MSRHSAAGRTSVICGMLLLVVGMCCQVWGVEHSSVAGKSSEWQQLRRDLQTLQLLEQLKLSETQCRQTLTAALEVEEIKRTHASWRKEHLQEMVDVFSQFRDEAEANRGFSDALERRTARLDHAEHDARDESIRRIQGIEERVNGLLTIRQRELIENFSPSRRSVKGARRGGRLSSRTGDELTWDDSSLERVVKEMDWLTSKRPRLGTIGRLLLSSQAIVYLRETPSFWRLKPSIRARRTVPVLRPVPVDVSSAKLERQAMLVRHDINLLNLVNGLDFSQAQVSGLLSCAKEARAANSRVRTSWNTADAVRAMKQVRLDIYRFGKIRDGTLKQMRQLARSRRKSSSRTIRDIEIKVESLLSEGQKSIVGEYKPCLIPNLEDPVRVGQASDGTHELKMLERVRKMPPGRAGGGWSSRLDRLLDKEEEHRGAYTPTEREARRKQLVELVARVRAMSDTEFHMCKEELIAELQAADRILEASKKIDELQRNRRNRPGKYALFLLNERIVPILGKRLAQMSSTR